MAKLKPTHRKHNPFHDYKSRCIYHITLVVSDRCKVFGRMVDARESADLGKVAQPNGDAHYGRKVYKPNGEPDYGRKPDGTPWTEAELADSARVQFTPLGLDIQRKIQEIPYEESKGGNDVQILGACVMPEHIHFVLFIRKPSKKVLGLMIRGFKQGCNKLLKKYLSDGLEKPTQPDGEGVQPSVDSMPSASPSGIAPFLREAIEARRAALEDPTIGKHLLEDHALFEDDFDETRLRRKGQLPKMIAYVHNNPKHRWLRDNKPEWLLPIRGIEIAGRMYDAIGNVNLLALQRFQDHTRYKWYLIHDEESIRHHMNDCVIHARKNFAIVSPFVNPDEAKVRDFCLQEGHSIIQLCDNGFSDLQQCPGGLYDYCVNGQVLLLAPSDWPHIDNKGTCTRQECNVLNSYAEEICNEEA